MSNKNVDLMEVTKKTDLLKIDKFINHPKEIGYLVEVIGEVATMDILTRVAYLASPEKIPPFYLNLIEQEKEKADADYNFWVKRNKAYSVFERYATADYFIPPKKDGHAEEQDTYDAFVFFIGKEKTEKLSMVYGDRMGINLLYHGRLCRGFHLLKWHYIELDYQNIKDKSPDMKIDEFIRKIANSYNESEYDVRQIIKEGVQA